MSEVLTGVPVLDIPGLPEPMPLTLPAWETWRDQVVLPHRELRWELANRDPVARERERLLCAQRDGLGLLYWLCTYGFIYEPRADPADAVRAFVPYPRQADLVLAMEATWTTPRGAGAAADLLVSKCRDVGATWLMVADDAWAWQFLPTYQGRLVSRNEDLVDMPGNPDAMFWKLDFLLHHQPAWLLPAGFAWKRHRTKLKLLNPATGSAIIGESAAVTAGRGGRATRRKYDEGAFIQNFLTLWDAAANATEHRMVVSSESVEFDDGFFVLEHGRDGRATPALFAFDWYQVPEHDRAWYDDMKARLSEDAFAREVLRSATAGLGEWVYPEAKTRTVADYPYVEGWPLYVAIDDGYDGDTALVWLQKNPQSGRIRVIEAYTNRHKPIDFYGSLLNGGKLLDGTRDERFDFDAHDHAILDFTAGYGGARMPMYFGDKHGDNTELSSGESPFGRLLNQYGIYVVTNAFKRTSKDRRDALQDLLLRLDFHDTPGVRHLLLALQEARFPKRRDSSQSMAESKEMIHNWASHPVTALEYFAVNEELTFLTKPPPRGPRATIGSKRGNFARVGVWP